MSTNDNAFAIPYMVYTEIYKSQLCSGKLSLAGERALWKVIHNLIQYSHANVKTIAGLLEILRPGVTIC